MKKYFICILLLICSCVVYDEGSYQVFPKDLSWASIDTDGDGIFENYISSIKLQPCSDCYFYSVVGLLEIQFQIDHKSGTGLNLSEQSLHNCLRITCNGAGDQRIVLKYIKEYGIVDEEYVPTGYWNNCLTCLKYVYSGIGIVPIENIPLYTFDKYEEIISPKVPYKDRKGILVRALQYGPVVMDISSWPGFKKYGDILSCIKKDPFGHSVIVVGYEDHGSVFLIKNSHGEETLLRVVFDGADECGFAHFVHRIVPGTTKISYGLGNKFCYSTNDTDGDRIADVHDNCPYIKNPEQLNSDGDLLGDECDPCPLVYDYSTNFYCHK